MRLLVSVRSAEEVRAAVEGGADIVDAKEPALGSLGAVSGSELRGIAARLPPDVPLSVALGDVADPAALEPAMTVLDGLPRRPGDSYVKMGFAAAGPGSPATPDAVRAVLERAVSAAARTAFQPLVVAVAYADHERARAPSPDLVLRAAADARAGGVLLDTWSKDGGDLFHCWSAPALRAWAEGARRAGLLVAMAGSLTVDGVRRAAALPVDVVGVRGAACTGGRSGVVASALVAGLKTALGGRIAVG